MKRVFALLIALLASLSVAFAAVNVNTATQAELETLNGIGPAKAKAIIDYRNKNGPFKSLDELDKVAGVGAGTLAKIRNDVTLTGSTTLPTATKGTEKKGAVRAPTSKASTDDTAKNKAAQSPSSGMKAPDKREPGADKKAATAGADSTRASKSTKKTDKTKADDNEQKTKSSKKDNAKSESSK